MKLHAAYRSSIRANPAVLDVKHEQKNSPSAEHDFWYSIVFHHEILASIVEIHKVLTLTIMLINFILEIAESSLKFLGI